VAIASLVVLPIVVLAGHALMADASHWVHLAEYVLPQALRNTASPSRVTALACW